MAAFKEQKESRRLAFLVEAEGKEEVVGDEDGERPESRSLGQRRTRRGQCSPKYSFYLDQHFRPPGQPTSCFILSTKQKFSSKPLLCDLCVALKNPDQD